MKVFKIKYIVLAAISSILLLNSCMEHAHEQKAQKLVDKYPNILDIEGIPQKPYDLGSFGFSDRGAWHGYTLPHRDSTSYYGGFSGPLLMKMYGQWLSKSIALLQIRDTQNNSVINLSNAKANMTYYPGRLEQKLQLPQLDIIMKLVFASGRTALISTRIINKGPNTKSLKIGWKGALMIKEADISPFDKGVKITMKKDSSFLILQTGDHPVDINISKDNSSYQISNHNPIDIAPGAYININLTQTYCFNTIEFAKEAAIVTKSITKYDTIFQENTRRWNNYLYKALSSHNTLLKDSSNKKIVVKCIITLMTNWRSPAGALKHEGIFPSAAYQGFYGFWSWDSWKHAVALVRFAPDLAKNSIRSMFDFQNDMGMVADCVYYDPKDNNWRDTKAPLAAWAVWKIFETTNDKQFVKEMYPSLVKYHTWWYKYRDHNKNGLCEYGSTDGTLIAAKWESGMDNAVRYDRAKMLKNNNNGWSMDQESVDLNAYLFSEKEYLSKMAAVLGKGKDALNYKKEASVLKKELSEKFWDQQTGYFYDRSVKDGKLLTVQQGPEGWIPMYTGMINKHKAKEIRNIIMDTTRFDTNVPFPTLAANHQKFNPLKGYWRGPVWLDQAYFGIKALQQYGFTKEADKLTLKLLNNAHGLRGTAPIRENYHPLTGKGLNATHFSWSAAHYLMLLTDK